MLGFENLEIYYGIMTLGFFVMYLIGKRFMYIAFRYGPKKKRQKKVVIKNKKTKKKIVKKQLKKKTTTKKKK